MRTSDTTTGESTDEPRFPAGLVSAAVALTVGMAVWWAWDHHNDSAAHATGVRSAVVLSKTASRILYLDEMLTMSARMAAATGDKAWIDRYRQFEPELDRLIREAESLAPGTGTPYGVRATEQANLQHEGMEKASFDLVLQGRKDEALALLTGPEYQRQTRICAAGMNAFVGALEVRQRADTSDQQRRCRTYLVLQCAITAVVLALWCLAMKKVAHAWRRKVARHEMAVKALALSEERLRVTLRSIGDGVLATDTQRRVTQLNRMGEQMTGWSLEEALGRPAEEVFQIIDERTRAAVANPIDEVLKTGQPQTLANHTVLIARDGTERAVADSAAAILDASGGTLGTVLVFRDVTEQRLREAALKESEERFRAIFENAPDGILIADSNHKRFRNCNPAICRMLGYSPEEIPSLGVMDIHPEKDLPYVVDQFEKQLRKEITLAKDLPVIRKDGSVFYADVCAFPLVLEGKECLVGLFRDVSEGKKMEDLLRNSECKYRSLFEGTGDAVMLLDEVGFFECNQATLKVFGCATREEFIGAHPADFSPPLQADGWDSRTAATERIAEAMADGTAHFEWLHWRKDHTTFPADVLLTRMDLQDRSILQAVVRDTTEMKQYQQQLAHLASHDPLTGLPNRRLFEDALRRAAARSMRGTPSALLLFDVDRFKTVNDTSGHAAGDEALIRVAKLARKQLRTEDILARMGGDEFVVLLEGVSTEQARIVAERIRQAVADAWVVADHGPRVSLSMGVAAIDGSEDLQALFTAADTAMYEAKQQGRNRVVLQP